MADCAALGGFRETARTGSPVHALQSAWRGPVTRQFGLRATWRSPGGGAGHEANGFSRREGNAAGWRAPPSRGDGVPGKDSGSL